ncbi:hypothetical protein THOM_0621 [Trachipleistophora hominis]|uniref:Uncharacterized protein n=1 Tax=Trachipleistophora hominis TaxID=72359 RepID=L7JZB4_TRAHO|nr:hypothetical protein THOM_0621 [Trachipleistophora hominis]
MKVKTHQSGELVKIPTDFNFDGMIYPRIKGVIVFSDYGMGRIIIH